MEFTINRDAILKPLSHACGIIEKKTTIPILSNILIEAKDSKIKITATDLDIIYSEEIPLENLIKEGVTTTSATTLHDILRKLDTNTKVDFLLQDSNKLKLISGNSKFNLLCMPSDNFPFPEEDKNLSSFEISAVELSKLLNKTKIAISNDETRHYLNGIYFHKINLNNKFYLSAVATDSHRLSSCRIPIDSSINFEPIILPKKTIFQLISLLEQNSGKIKISNNKSKIQFLIGSSLLISKVIDGRFPDYKKVIPTNNSKALQIKLNDFKNSIERVTTVSSDHKEGLKMLVSKDSLKLSVNNPNSGDGSENIKAQFNSDDIEISFNSRYLIDIASQIESESILINDIADKNSFHVVMPMKI